MDESTPPMGRGKLRQCLEELANKWRRRHDMETRKEWLDAIDAEKLASEALKCINSSCRRWLGWRYDLRNQPDILDSAIGHAAHMFCKYVIEDKEFTKGPDALAFVAAKRYLVRQLMVASGQNTNIAAKDRNQPAAFVTHEQLVQYQLELDTSSSSSLRRPEELTEEITESHPESYSSPEGSWIRSATSLAVRKSLEQLALQSPECVEYLEARHLNGATDEDGVAALAERFGLKQTTFFDRLKRCEKKLRELLELSGVGALRNEF